jgi:hypothetical protein
VARIDQVALVEEEEGHSLASVSRIHS